MAGCSRPLKKYAIRAAGESAATKEIPALISHPYRAQMNISSDSF